MHCESEGERHRARVSRLSTEYPGWGQDGSRVGRLPLRYPEELSVLERERFTGQVGQ